MNNLPPSVYVCVCVVYPVYMTEALKHSKLFQMKLRMVKQHSSQPNILDAMNTLANNL